MPADIDLLPRVVLHPPGGAVVIDPFSGAGDGTVTILGVSVPYEVVWGPPAVTTEEQLIPRLQGAGLLVLVLAGAWMLARRR